VSVPYFLTGNQFWPGLGASITAGGLSGGIASTLMGGKFGQGAWMGAAFAAVGYIASAGLNRASNGSKTDAEVQTQQRETADIQGTLDVAYSEGGTEGVLILASDMNLGDATGKTIDTFYTQPAQIKKEITFIKDFFAIEPKIAATMRVGSGDYFNFRINRFTGHILGVERISVVIKPEYGYIQNPAGYIETKGPYFIAGSSTDSMTYFQNNRL